MERKVVIVHHNDMDGIFSGAIIYDYEKNINKADWIKCIKVDYTMDLYEAIGEDIYTLEDIIVYFVDYSFSKKENIDIISTILNNRSKVIWIDHHSSSKELLESLPEEITKNANFDANINTEYCATVLCYEWAHKTKNNKAILNLVDSWDSWKHNVDNDREFNEGFRSFHYSAEDFGELIGIILVFEEKETNFINDCISKGTTICNYLDENNEQLCKSNGFEFNIDYFGTKYTCFGLCQYGNSLVFGDRINEYDIVVLMRFNGDQFVYSLYSNKDEIECNKIASDLGTFDSLGGGGHKGAAGFQTYDNIFFKDTTVKVYKSLIGNKTKIKYNITED